MKSAERDHGAVRVPSGIPDVEVDEDVPRRERQVGVAEGTVVDVHLKSERGKDVLAIVAAHVPGDLHAARRLHRGKVAGIYCRDERQDVGESGPRRAEGEVGGDAVVRHRDQTGEVERQVVQPERILAEREPLLSRVGIDVGGEIQPHVAEIWDAGEPHRHRVGGRP